MTRDLTRAQFKAQCERYGFVRVGFLGYYKLPPPFENHHVSVLNAGDRRRDQLAYLLEQERRAEGKERNS